MCIGRFDTFEDDALFTQCEERVQKYEKDVHRYLSCLEAKSTKAQANLSEIKNKWTERACQFRDVDQSQCE